MTTNAASVHFGHTSKCSLKVWLYFWHPVSFIWNQLLWLCWNNNIFHFKKWTNPGLFFVFFGLSKQTSIQFLQQICEKMSIPSSIRCQDSNPRPLDHESSSPITTRPGLPPITLCLVKYKPVRQEVICTVILPFPLQSKWVFSGSTSNGSHSNG